MEANTRLSATALAQVRDNLDKVLADLQLDAYIFEVEPCDGQWKIIVECATNDGWQTVNYSADEEYLLRCVDDSIVHEVIIDGLREALSSCTLQK